jgi:hypothetical protein
LVPPDSTKVKIFVYLADIDSPSTRANLLHKSCAPSDGCVACTLPKTVRHLFFDSQGIPETVVRCSAWLMK